MRGPGIPESGVRMTINTRLRSIEINGLKGHIGGAEEIDLPGLYEISWRWSLTWAYPVALDAHGARPNHCDVVGIA